MAKYIGLMSGTSMDGVDAVLCDISHTSCTTLAAHSIPYSAELLTALNALCSEGPDELNSLAIADRLVAENRNAYNSKEKLNKKPKREITKEKKK